MFNHMRINRTREKSRKYNICQADFITRFELTEHTARKHMKILRYKCTVCFKSFCAKQELKGHYGRVHCSKSEYRYKCGRCGKRFFNKADLLTHHNSLIHEKKRVTCIFCSDGRIYFHNSASFLQHMSNHTREKPKFCRICSAEFVINSIMNCVKRNRLQFKTIILFSYTVSFRSTSCMWNT